MSDEQVLATLNEQSDRIAKLEALLRSKQLTIDGLLGPS
jgi:hypothetical protein